MVLDIACFKLHRSLRKRLNHLLGAQRLEIRFDHGFERVIQACAHKPRAGQPGTWIVPDMVKMALCALVAFCSAHHVTMIDCQQNTQHLASLGAAEISREDFIEHLHSTVGLAAPAWHFNPLYFNEILAPKAIATP